MSSMSMARSGVVNVVFDAPPPPPPPYPPPSPAQKRRTQQLQSFGTNGPSQRQQIDPPPLKRGSNNNDDDDNATRARLYKAEAYEAKVRLASQDQRIQELQAELEEMRLFQKMEAESRGTACSADGLDRENINKDDAELIEALAVELETTEKDLNAAQARVAELEKELQETKVKSEDTSKMSSSPNQREAELIKQLELKQKELNNAKNDAKEGVNIVKDLHGALRLARAERDEARSTLSTLQSGMEQKIVRDLEAALKTMRRERDEALIELSSLFEEVNSLRECSAICEKLELSNKSLQTELEKMQSQSEPDVHEQLLEALAREDTMKQQNDKLVEETRQMESALEDIVRKYEEQRTELSMQTAALKELQDLHVTNIADLKKEHANEVEQMRSSHEDVIKRLESRHEQELRLQSELFKSQERDWEEKISFLQEELSNSGAIIKEYEAIQSTDRIEIENLQNELKEMNNVANDTDMDLPHDELLAGLQMENAKLNDELQRKLEEYKHVTSELESKSLELTELQSSFEQQPLISDGEILPKTEMSFTQDETESDAAISYRGESSVTSDPMSRIEMLERELARSKKANITLEDALRDMQVALVAVSRRKPSPLRREIENDALREYCAHRLLVDE